MRDKLEETEKQVQAFISEMGSMIDTAEKDPSLGLLHMNDMAGHQADMRTVDGASRSGMPRGGQNNPNYVGWGGSGESTGGSARHY